MIRNICRKPIFMDSQWSVVVLAACLAIVANIVTAQVPDRLNYQGVLKTAMSGFPKGVIWARHL